MRPADMFVLDREGAVKEAPAARPPPYKAPKLTECAPLFQSVRCRLQGLPSMLEVEQDGSRHTVEDLWL